MERDSSMIVSLGGINIDLVAMAPRFPEPGETVVGSAFLSYGGGKGANQAVAAARMGARTAMVGRVGDDIFADQALAALVASGVDVSAVGVTRNTSTGIAVIEIDEGGQNRIIQVLGANDTCGEEEFTHVSRLLNEASALLLQLEVSIELSLRCAQAAREGGVRVILDPSPVRPLPNDFYACCDIITPNETDAQALVGIPVTDTQSAAIAAGILLERGVGAAIITLGARGAYFATPQGGGFVPALPVMAVDSVGAGDAFNGALAVALSEGKELEEAVKIATAAGALSVTKNGAQDAMPTRNEVDVLVASSFRELE